MNSLLVLGIIFIASVTAKNNDLVQSSCNQPDCLRCDLRSTQCVKCLHVMLTGTRECHTTCPHGFDATWADDINIFGRICKERSIMSMVSYREVWVIAGASIVGVISLGILLGIFLLRHKGAKAPPDFPPRGLPKSIQDKRPKTAEIAIKGKEREEFLSRLRSLRADAPHIFQMMASTRNRYKNNSSFGCDNPSDAKTKACKAVCRDLSRVLCLLSLKEEYLKTAPKDWRPLLSWTERLLVRYKRQGPGLDVRDGGITSADGCKINNPSNIKENRSLFITRQEKLKEEQEKRRLAQMTSTDPLYLQTEKIVEPESQFSQNIKLYHNQPKADCVATTVIKEYWVSASKESETGPMRILAVKNKDDFSTTIKKKIKTLLSTLIKLRNAFFSPSSFKAADKEKDLEKGKYPGNNSGNSKNKGNDIVFNDSEDDIASQVFFDHIEAFAFDPLEESKICDEISQSKPNSTKKRRGSAGLYRNKLINDVNRKNYMKNSKCDQDSEKLFIKENHKEQIKKVSRPSSKLRRFSSTLLSKEKRNIVSNGNKFQKRRPLKRQKQVEKSSRSKVLQKYQNKYFDEAFTSDQTDSNEEMSHQMSNYEEKNDSCPNNFSYNFTEGNFIQEFDDLLSPKYIKEAPSCFQPRKDEKIDSSSQINYNLEGKKNWLKHHTNLEILTCV